MERILAAGWSRHIRLVRFAGSASGDNSESPADWIAYTPTAMPHGGSCIEITGVHLGDHNLYGLPYNDAFGIWDWCNRNPSGNYAYRYWANSTVYAFRDPYVRTY